MRAIGQSERISVKAYAGTSGVIVAFDVGLAKRAGLLGHFDTGTLEAADRERFAEPGT